jgi:hypothetical protein
MQKDVGEIRLIEHGAPVPEGFTEIGMGEIAALTKGESNGADPALSPDMVVIPIAADISIAISEKLVVNAKKTLRGMLTMRDIAMRFPAARGTIVALDLALYVQKLAGVPEEALLEMDTNEADRILHAAMEAIRSHCCPICGKAVTAAKEADERDPETA